MALIPAPFATKFLAPDGQTSEPWQRFLLSLRQTLTDVQTVTNTLLGVNILTRAQVNAVVAPATGYTAFVTTYAHLVYWDGAAWQRMDDAPGEIHPFVVAPGAGYALCDGSATDYLVLGGATLTVTAFTTPNLTGTASYLKTGATYTGTLNAASGTTGTGTTGTGTTGTGTTGTGTSGGQSNDHTHSTGGANTGGASSTVAVQSGSGASVTDGAHTHLVFGSVSAGTSAGHTHSAPALSVPGLSVPGLSVPALGVGSLDPPNLVMLPYFRR